ncbi:BatD family protein [Aeromonas tecta]|uniref:BatD family protein n=1 Tax=Aeromonas tecta TaxID=324617 RepID=UPI0009F996A8|nr:BatD family protein [Aeromonas tecta]
MNQALAASPRAELLPGASEGDWLLIIEADGERRSDELNLTPLLRQFAVGRVTLSRVTTEVQSLTRWQIPLSVARDTNQIPALTLGSEQTPPLPLPERNQPDTASAAASVSPVELQASVLHQGPLYPGQPFIYQLSLWLPDNMEAPNLSEPSGSGFTIRRLGNDQWESPASPGMPGRLTRKWLLQAKETGLHPLESPRFEGTLSRARGQSDKFSARAATQFVKVDKAPLEPVASTLILRQQFSPATGARVGEPVIRTLTLVMEGGDGSRLPMPPFTVPSELRLKPDGEQQQEQFTAKGALRFERQWRQALTADAAGGYSLPAVDLPWFNTQSGRIEHARLPAQTLRFEANTEVATTSQAPHGESLYWVLAALLLRALWQHWPRWRAFYHLQRALAAKEPDSARWALLSWSERRWGGSHLHLASLPCHGDPAIGPLLDGLDRACFSPSSAIDGEPDWLALGKGLCAYETFAIAYSLRTLARMSR